MLTEGNGNEPIYIISERLIKCFVQGTAEYCLCSLHRDIVYKLQTMNMRNYICGGGIHV